MSAPAMVFDWHVGDDPATLLGREWLVTNGIGGYASGTLLGVATRRFHGLLIANLAEPKGRYMTLARLDEELECGGERYLLGGAERAAERLDTSAHRWLRSFRFERLMPQWEFECGGRRFEKTVVMPHGHNVVCVRYRVLSGAPLQLRLRPHAAFRRQDAPLVREPPAFRLVIAAGRHTLELLDSPLALRFGMRPAPGVFVADERVDADVLYRIERDRGYEHLETLLSPGYFQVELSAGGAATFVASTADWSSLELDGDHAVEAETRRCERLIAAAPAAARSGVAAQLVLAADQFVILPGSRPEESVLAGAAGEEARTVIAGYHWFGDWGRDTMISLEGLTLCTGRHAEAEAILRTFSHYVHDGLLPNLFPEGAREALYHTVDATLWYFHAIDRFVHVSGRFELVEELWPILAGIIEHHVHGTRFGIGVDHADGLLREGAPDLPLTWMDARMEGWVVTPRCGKPVEIQALWANALALMAGWGERLGRVAEPYRRLAAQAYASFNRRFWNARAGCLYDLIDGEAGDDPAVRPNQVFAISLRHPVLDESRWRPTLARVREALLTPVGLRTLSPDHPQYCRRYFGDLRARDSAYHQGTVWPWLLGHFVEAWLRAFGDRQAARAMLAALPLHLRDAGIGSVSEIFDAESPYEPRGCIAQAWSVAEILRAWLLTEDTAPVVDER
jgi:predicted glycogen debranching enzyme